MGKKSSRIIILRRIFAWLALAGFIFLVINILYLGWEREVSSFIYLALAVFFILSVIYKKRTGSTAGEKPGEPGEGDSSFNEPGEDDTNSGEPGDNDISSGELMEDESFSEEHPEEDNNSDKSE